MEPGEVKFTFGKYDGYSVSQVYDMEKGYLYWCIKTPGVIRKHPKLISAIRNHIDKCKYNNNNNKPNSIVRMMELKIIT
jgi:hypothetical protein